MPNPAFLSVHSDHTYLYFYQQLILRTYALSYQTNPHYNRQRVSEATLTNGSAGFRDTSHVYVPKLGRIRCKGSRKILAHIFSMHSVRIGTMTVSRDACGGYFLSMQLASDEPFVPSLPKTGSAIGIDLNLKNFYVDSNGQIGRASCRERV